MLPLLLRPDENRLQLTGDSVKKTAVAFDISRPILRVQVILSDPQSMPAGAHSRYPSNYPDRTKTHGARSERRSGIHRPDPHLRLFSEHLPSLCDFLFTVGI